MKHRKGSIARAIQDYFLSGKYNEMIDSKDDMWMWFPIPKHEEFCVALEWQDGYEGDIVDDVTYGDFGVHSGENFYVINASIKMTDEFRLNGSYALYAETYYTEEGEDLSGSISLSDFDFRDDFYRVSKSLAQDVNTFFRMKKVREDL